MLPNSVRYSPELAEEICARLSAGESLNSICKDAHMPVQSAIRKWVLEDVDGFSEKYARAREMQVEFWAEQIIDISDNVPQGADAAAVQAARLQSDNRRWLAAKLLPRKYGERTTITGANDTPLIPANTATPDRVAAVFLALAEKLPRARAIEHSKDDDDS